MKLSIIIPVFNEEKTISEILRRVDRVEIPGVKKQIIVVNDGSTDATKSEINNSKLKIQNFEIFNHTKNQGKGAAVKTGIRNATGDFIIIQDADLEYDPKDIEKLMKPIITGKNEVVYGTRLNRLPRFSRDERTPRFLLHYLGNKFLSLLTSIIYGNWITDMETCYKLFPTKAARKMNLNARGFEFEPEITAKLLKSGYKICEVPIGTNPRGYSEGKKLSTFKDGFKTLWSLMKYKFVD
ncbi:MAG: glycosyltransferase family 2 protein [Candidatus Levybacteria bacterium]|nr:glycosyltransferase family 2 protein [Candidatus Levybacteria bacterium]